MSGGPQGHDEAAGPAPVACRRKSAEAVVAVLFLLAGALVVVDSIRLGAKWADDGPQAGYFPFFIGLILCGSALVNFVASVRVAANETFVETEQLKLVLAVLVPAAIYVGLVGWLGIYVASVLFIAFFMRWLGKYGWWMLAAVSVGNSVFFFLVFEIWFKIPLPKGPLEAWLRLN